MSDMTEYARELSYQLRWRHLPESEVERAVAEVIAESAAAERSAAELFRAANAYAQSFARGKRLHVGYLVTSISIVAALVVVGGTAFAGLILRVPYSLIAFLALIAVAIVWCFVMAYVGSSLESRLPRNLPDAAS